MLLLLTYIIAFSKRQRRAGSLPGATPGFRSCKKIQLRRGGIHSLLLDGILKPLRLRTTKLDKPFSPREKVGVRDSHYLMESIHRMFH